MEQDLLDKQVVLEPLVKPVIRVQMAIQDLQDHLVELDRVVTRGLLEFQVKPGKRVTAEVVESLVQQVRRGCLELQDQADQLVRLERADQQAKLD